MIGRRSRTLLLGHRQLTLYQETLGLLLAMRTIGHEDETAIAVLEAIVVTVFF